MTELREPPEKTEFASGSDLARALFGLLIYACRFVGVLWALCVKKFGTVGTRAYPVDAVFGFLLLLAMSGTPLMIDKAFFVCCLILLPILYIKHLIATNSSSEHVHTQCLGDTRWGATTDALLGGLLGFFIAVCGAAHFGIFLCVSAFAHYAYLGIIEERDRQRCVKMSDAMAEQEYMMRQFER